MEKKTNRENEKDNYIQDMAEGHPDSKGVPVDETDAKSVKKWMKSLLQKSESEIPQVATLSAEKDDDEYFMNHKTRGKAIIFNHKTFIGPDDPPIRKGTDADRDNLAETLRRLDFQVEIYNDLSYIKLNQIISEVSREDHSNSDCLLIAVFSHGVPNQLYASDIKYNRDELWDLFTAEKCPTLAGKPKIFLIQACQGNELDGGTELQPRQPSRRDEVDSAPQKNVAYKIPNRVDFFMACSTHPGYYSWRNNTRGSWFIQSLCDVLLEHGNRRSFMSLMTIVSRKVAIEYESFVPRTKMDQQKQVVFITTTLIRELYFRPKSTSGCVGSIDIKVVKVLDTPTKDRSSLLSPSPRKNSNRSERDSGNDTSTSSYSESECVVEATLVPPTEKSNTGPSLGPVQTTEKPEST